MKKIFIIFTFLFLFFKINNTTASSPYPLYPLSGIKISTPQKISFPLTFTTNPLIQVEPGLCGCKLQMGHIWSKSSAAIPSGSAIKISILKTWNNPSKGIKSNQTYLGIEFERVISFINLNLGLYTHIHGDDKGHDQIISLGIGIGLV